jgi:hypothetical protein
MELSDMDPLLRGQIEEAMVTGGADKLGQSYHVDKIEPGSYSFTFIDPYPNMADEISVALRTLALNKKSFVTSVVFAETATHVALPYTLTPGSYCLDFKGDQSLFVLTDDGGEGGFTMRDLDRSHTGQRDGSLAMNWHMDGKLMRGGIKFSGEHPGDMVNMVVDRVNGLFHARPNVSAIAKDAA